MSKTLEALYERKRELHADMSSLLETRGPDLNEDDARDWTSMDVRMTELESDIAAEERRCRLEAIQRVEEAGLAGQRRPGSPEADTGLDSYSDESAERRALFTWIAGVIAPQRRQEAWEQCSRYMGHHVETRDLSTTVPSGGGYTVPTPLRGELLRLVQEFAVLRPLVNILAMESMTLDIPDLQTEPTVAIVDEGQTIPQSDPEFGQVQLLSKVLAAYTVSSEQLLQDSVLNIGRMYAQLLAEAMGRAEDQQALEGTGAGNEFEGLLNVTGVTDIPAGGALTNLDIMIQSQRTLAQNDAIAARNASWILSPLVWEKISALKDQDNRYQLNVVPTVGTPLSMLGNPVYLSNQISDTRGAGNDSTIYYGDFRRGMYYGQRQGFVMFTDPYSRSTSLQTIIRGHQRIAIKTVLPKAFVRVSGVLTT